MPLWVLTTSVEVCQTPSFFHPSPARTARPPGLSPQHSQPARLAPTTACATYMWGPPVSPSFPHLFPFSLSFFPVTKSWGAGRRTAHGRRPHLPSRMGAACPWARMPEIAAVHLPRNPRAPPYKKSTADLSLILSPPWGFFPQSICHCTKNKRGRSARRRRKGGDQDRRPGAEPLGSRRGEAHPAGAPIGAPPRIRSLAHRGLQFRPQLLCFLVDVRPRERRRRRNAKDRG
jgi:hypothetical protein